MICDAQHAQNGQLWGVFYEEYSQNGPFLKRDSQHIWIPSWQRYVGTFTLRRRNQHYKRPIYKTNDKVFN